MLRIQIKQNSIFKSCIHVSIGNWTRLWNNAKMWSMKLILTWFIAVLFHFQLTILVTVTLWGWGRCWSGKKTAERMNKIWYIAWKLKTFYLLRRPVLVLKQSGLNTYLSVNVKFLHIFNCQKVCWFWELFLPFFFFYRMIQCMLWKMWLLSLVKHSRHI